MWNQMPFPDRSCLRCQKWNLRWLSWSSRIWHQISWAYRMWSKKHFMENWTKCPLDPNAENGLLHHLSSHAGAIESQYGYVPLKKFSVCFWWLKIGTDRCGLITKSWGTAYPFTVTLQCHVHAVIQPPWVGVFIIYTIRCNNSCWYSIFSSYILWV